MKLIINITQTVIDHAIAGSEDSYDEQEALLAIVNGKPLVKELQEIRQEIEHLYKNNQHFDILTIINVLSIIDKHINQTGGENKE